MVSDVVGIIVVVAGVVSGVVGISVVVVGVVVASVVAADVVGISNLQPKQVSMHKNIIRFFLDSQ